MLIIPISREPTYDHECPHCGYQFNSPAGSPWVPLLVGLCVIFGIWLFITLVYWMTSTYPHGPRTLVQVLVAQWHWLVALAGRVW